MRTKIPFECSPWTDHQLVVAQRQLQHIVDGRKRWRQRNSFAAWCLIPSLTLWGDHTVS